MTTLDPIALAALPVGTSNAQAFSRNASDLDSVVNGTSSVTTRTGRSVLSIDEAMRRIGYEPPVAFTSGLSIARATQTVIYSGLTYHANPVSVPFTTTGTFSAGQWLLISNITAQDLASTASGKGASLIGLQDAGGNWDAANLEALSTEIKAKIRKPVVAVGALQAAVTAGGAWRLGDGVYTLTSAITADYSSTSFPAQGLASTRAEVVGDGRGNTIISQSTSGADGIHMIGRADAAYQGAHGLDGIRDVTLTRTTAGTGKGIKIEHKAYTAVTDVCITKYAYGLWLNGVLSSTVSNAYLTGNTVGMVIDYSGSALLPNANLFSCVQFADNSTAGIIANSSGATNVIIGGSTENNSVTGALDGGGMLLNVTGMNGTGTWTISGHYFEANGGVADLLIRNTSGNNITVVVSGCTFNRTLSTRYTQTNIKLENTGGGSIRCVLVGCGFLSSGTYSPNSSRPFWSIDSSSEIVDIGCTFSEGVSRPNTCRSTMAPVICGVVESTGAAISALPPGVTVTKIATGVYRITRALGWGLDQYGYVATANQHSTTGHANCIHISELSFDVRTLTAGGTAVDDRFSFMVSQFH